MSGYLGQVCLKNTDNDFGIMLVKKGFAQLNVLGVEIPLNYHDLFEEQESAKNHGIGIWEGVQSDSNVTFKLVNSDVVRE
jgi:endonuclease YncB( thermonuclease family)